MTVATLQTVIESIVAEVHRAIAKFPTWPTDPLHAAGVVGEEFGELQKAVVQAVYEPHKSGIAEVKAEATQAAAMAIRFMISLDVYRFAPGDQHHQPAIAGEHGAAPARVSREDRILSGYHPATIILIQGLQGLGEAGQKVLADWDVARGRLDARITETTAAPAADATLAACVRALRAVQRMRKTSIIDDDFPVVRDRADGEVSHALRLVEGMPIEPIDQNSRTAIVVEYMAARDAYDKAVAPPNSHAQPRRLKHGDPIVIRYRIAKTALEQEFTKPE